ncbi:MAG: hypothetical protein JSV32_03595, partial [Dehalococcoidia bacterium]
STIEQTTTITSTPIPMIPTTTTTTTPTTTIPNITIIKAIPTITWGELAIKGIRSFNACTECHGEEGEGSNRGPEIVGTALEHFGNAQRLFDYIRALMPLDGPGSLSDLMYMRIMAFMLVESGFVQPEDIFNADDLANVILGENQINKNLNIPLLPY